MQASWQTGYGPVQARAGAAFQTLPHLFGPSAWPDKLHLLLLNTAPFSALELGARRARRTGLPKALGTPLMAHHTVAAVFRQG